MAGEEERDDGEERGLARKAGGDEREERAADDHAERVAGDEKARAGDGDPEVGGDGRQQARDHELGRADGEAPEEQRDERGVHAGMLRRQPGAAMARRKAASVSELTWCSMPSASIRAVSGLTPSERRKASTVWWRSLLSAATRRPSSVRNTPR